MASILPIVYAGCCCGYHVGILINILKLAEIYAGCFVDRRYLRPGLEAVQVVAPLLHQLSAFRQVLGEIVGRLDAVTLTVAQLTLDNV